MKPRLKRFDTATLIFLLLGFSAYENVVSGQDATTKTPEISGVDEFSGDDETTGAPTIVMETSTEVLTEETTTAAALPELPRVTILRFTEECIIVLIEEQKNYDSYQIRLESDSRTIVINTTTAYYAICSLDPSTEYNISTAGLSLTSTSGIITDPVFSSPRSVTTKNPSLFFGVTLSNLNFTANLNDISSAESRNLIGLYTPQIVAAFQSAREALGFSAVKVRITGFRSGSVRADVEVETDSVDPNVGNIDVSTVFNNTGNLSDAVTIVPATPPANVRIQNITATTAIVSYDSVENALSYVVKIQCYGSSPLNLSISTLETTVNVSGLPQYTNCEVQVGANNSTVTNEPRKYSVPQIFVTEECRQCIRIASALRLFHYELFCQLQQDQCFPNGATVRTCANEKNCSADDKRGVDENYIDECVMNTHTCNDNANCTNTLGSFTCTCNQGYSGNGTNCEDINECSDGTDNCDVNANCTNTGGAFTCACFSGYTGNGVNCADINECLEGTDNCDVNSFCTNINGSFTCSCRSGYTGNGSTCTDINECSDGTDNCDLNANCTNTGGAFTCACFSGYTGNGVNCTDINECSDGTDNCDVNANCTNTGGAFTCACFSGYTGNGVNCTDINECSDGTVCDANADCTNTLGSFSCACKSGYTGNGTYCTDIDECNDGAVCDLNAVCTNSVGAFTCTCRSGYSGNGVTCTAIPIPLNVTILNTNASCIQILIVTEGTYNSYQIKLESVLRTITINTTKKNSLICDLNSDTKHNVSAAVLSLTSTSGIFTDPVFSSPVSATTETVKAYLGVTINETFTTDLENTSSAAFKNVANRYSSEVTDGFNRAGFGANATSVRLLSIRAGSIICTFVVTTDSNQPELPLPNIGSAFADVPNFLNVVEIVPSPPPNIGLIDTTETTAKIYFDDVGNFAEIEVFVECSDLFGVNLKIPATDSFAEVTGLLPEDLCQFKVQGITGTSVPSIDEFGEFTTKACPSLTINTSQGKDFIVVYITYETLDQTTFEVTYQSTNTQNSNVVQRGSKEYEITNLEPGQQYVISVKSNGPCVESADVTVSTVAQCTLLCSNGECVVEGGEQKCYCDANYNLTANQDRCELIPICQRTQCGDNAQCFEPNGCQCDSGYVSIDGSCTLFDVCSNSPCQNGGTCSNNDGITPKCACGPNYGGLDCRIFRSPCLSRPCQNGGNCIANKETNSFQCSCQNGYTGETCESDINECEDSNICGSNAECNNVEGSYNCICNDGFRNERGTGNCIKIIAFPSGMDAGDDFIPCFQTVSSVVNFQFGIPFGQKIFYNIRTLANGVIYLGSNPIIGELLNAPYQSGFVGDGGNAYLAPFWDTFTPPCYGIGRVYYQAYDLTEYSLNQEAQTLVENVKQRIKENYNLLSFDPLFVYKATWENAVMSPGYDFYNSFTSTFQAVLATDGCETYVMYLYPEGEMLWLTDLRRINDALIGFSNGNEFFENEMQYDYRPDNQFQGTGNIGSVEKGQYFYKLSSDSPTSQQQARCGCRQWYKEDIELPPVVPNIPCPCNLFQNFWDNRYDISVAYIMELINSFYKGQFNSGDVSEWTYNSMPLFQCYQPFWENGVECCYTLRSIRRNFRFRRSFGALWSGPTGSRYFRHQIPWFKNRELFYFKNSTVFMEEYNNSLKYDLIPRRQCCIESNSAPYCSLFTERRPSATCNGYRPPIIRWFWGDPHLVTLDGASYTFNGLGEYYMVYSPNIFVLQARTERVLKADGNLSDATGFTAFAAQDYTKNSGVVQLEVNDTSDGKGVIVKVNGEVVTPTELQQTIESVVISVDNGSYSVAFPSNTKITVSASSYILSLTFDGNRNSLENRTEGLLGTWTGNEENDFKLRNGTILNFNDLKVTKNLDILNGTLSEQLLFPFGQSWQINETESLFNYTGGNDTYSMHNPANATEPPFLEVLVEEQRNTTDFKDKVGNCTIDGVLQRPCLYDYLVTNKAEVAENTLSQGEEAEVTNTVNTNSPPNITLPMDANIVNGFWQVKVGFQSQITFIGTDEDNNTLTYSIVEDASIEPPKGAIINSGTGVLTWTPTNENQYFSNTTVLSIEVDDGKEGVATVTVPIKFCLCLNNGSCSYNETIDEKDNFLIVGCKCTAAYTGNNCSADNDECLANPCSANVTCTDKKAPDNGFTCGPCPDGYTGDGFNCSAIDYCASNTTNTCSQICLSITTGVNCSCREGYRVNSTNSHLCDDIDECTESNPCDVISNSRCINTIGNYSCNCSSGYMEVNSSCVNIDECAEGNDNCDNSTTTCVDTDGSFACDCKEGYQSIENNTSSCRDIDECLTTINNICKPTEICMNTNSSYRCECREGYHNNNGTCENIDECANSTLNNCNLESNTTICIDSPGNYSCSCREGFTGNGTVCEDINDCASTPCTTNATCTNFAGGYTCSCDPGYEEENTSRRCIDIDECDGFINPPLNNCSSDGNCTNTDGSFTCTCKDGFTGDGVTCSDINECDSNPCGSIAGRCRNTNGSFICSCDDGFTGDGFTCANIDECLSKPCAPVGASCSDSIGSYSCSCNDGYTGNGTVCKDVDECLDTPCDANATCTNFDGGYNCTCDAGFTGDGVSCSDINECDSDPNPCTSVGSICLNNEGSYSCVCTVSYYGNGTTCTPKPVVSSPQVLTTTQRCINILIEENAQYYLYRVVLESSSAENITIDTSKGFAEICNLNPSTQYNVYVAVLALTSTSGNFTTLVFSSPASTTTGNPSIFIAFTVRDRPFFATLQDINSEESLALIEEIRQPLIEQINQGVSDFSVIDVKILNFRNGSTIATADAVTNSTDPEVGKTNVTGALNNSTNFTNAETITPATAPANVMVQNTTATTAFVSYDSVENASSYEVKTNCFGFNATTFTTSDNSTEVTGLPSNTICTLQVRASNITGQLTPSFYSDPTTFTTKHQVIILMTSASGTSVQLKLAALRGLVSITVTTRNSSGDVIANETTLTADVVREGDDIIENINDLTPGTSYDLEVSVITQDHEGIERTETNTTSVTTIESLGVSEVFITNVKEGSFVVEISKVTEASSYRVETYLGDELKNRTDSISNIVTIDGLQPLINNYMVSVAYGTPALSDFSPNVSTKTWNFTSTLETSLTLTWKQYRSGYFYTTSACIDPDSCVASDPISFNENATVRNLMSGTTYLIKVVASLVNTTAEITTDTDLFEVPQITRSSAPVLTQDSQDQNSINVSWEAVEGADSYSSTVYRRIPSEVATDVNGVGNTNLTTITLTNLTFGRNYTLDVCSTNAAGRTCASLDFSGFIPDVEAPVVTDVTQTNISLNIPDIRGGLSYNLIVYYENGSFRNTMNNISSSVTISSLQPGTVYLLSVEVVFEAGSKEGNKTSQITVPANPTNIILSQLNGTFAKVSWQVGTGVNNSIVTLRFANGTSVYERLNSTLESMFTLLQPGTNYTIVIRNQNSAGESGDASLTFQTAPRAPTDLNYPEVTQTSINITFSPSTGADMYRVAISIANLENMSSNTSNTTNTEFQLTNLVPGTNYSISVVAVYSAATAFFSTELQSLSSSSLNIVTAPPDVTNIRVVKSTSSSLEVEFDASKGATGYNITSTPSSSSPLTVNGNRGTLAGLNPGTPYFIFVEAFNEFGRSESTMSESVYTLPISPPDLAFSDFTTNSFVITWDAQQPNTTSTFYIPEVVLASDGSTPASIELVPDEPFISGLTVEVVGLQAGTEYNVTVQTFVSNPVSYSVVGEAVTELTLPGVPTGLEVTRQEVSSLTFEWEGVRSAENYSVSVSNASAPNSAIVTNTTKMLSYTASSLPSGIKYILRVTAVNRNGNGSAAVVEDYTIEEPFSSDVDFVTNTNSSITVNHTEVDGVKSYNITASNGGAVTSFCNSTNNSCTITGLESGTDYNVSSLGIYSSGSQSKPGSSKTFTTIPANPANLSIIPQDFAISATTPEVIGANLYRFDIDGTSAVVQKERIFIFAGLNSGKTYTIGIVAIKTTDYGNFTSGKTTEFATTTAAVPEKVNFTNVGPNQFDVSWSPIPGALNYTVTTRSSTTNGAVNETETSETTVTIDSLEPGTVYNVTVRGNYATASSAESDVAQQVTAPATPSDVQASSIMTDSISLSWNEVVTATAYRVRVNIVGSMPSRNQTVNNTFATFDNLPEGTPYEFVVVALNQELESFESTPLKQITKPLPPTFELNSTTQTTIMAMWTKPVGTNDYIVQLFKNVSFDVIENETTTDSTIEYTADEGLSPGQNYTLCVKARTTETDIGIQQTSEPRCVELVTDPGNTSLPIQIGSSSTSVTFTWTAAVGASEYEVTAIRESNASDVTTQRVKITTATISGLMPGESYAVSVKAFDPFGQMSIIFGIVSMQTNPLPPSLETQSVSATNITISWVKQDGLLYFIRIRRADNSSLGAGVLIQNNGIYLLGDVSNATISGLASGTEYVITILALTTFKRSVPETITLTTPPAPPVVQDVIAETTGITFVLMTPEGTAGVRIEGVASNGEMVSAGNVSTDSVTFTDITLGVPYNFTLTGLSASGATSEPVYEFNVEAPLLSIVFQVSLSSEFEYDPQYSNTSSEAYKELETRVLAELNKTLSNTFGLFTITINAIYNGSVVIEITVTVNKPNSTAQIVMEEFNNRRNNSVFDSDITTNLNLCLNFTCSEANTVCNNGSCICADGFKSETSTCVDINECNNRSICGNFGSCTNTNGSYICSCDSGFTGIGANCTDINECDSTPCDKNANCTNSPGSYSCSCNMGYIGNGTYCINENECTSGSSNPCDGNANCTDTNGSYTCSCNSGYTGNGSVCYDINECMSDPCDNNANCTNTNGSYTCSCNSGYTGNGSVCYDINECISDPCDNNANCTNTNGQYACSCNSGYTGNGSVCYDINECMSDPCDNNANCINTNGSYTCSCNSGYTGNGSVCYDINECMSDPCDNNANCTNTTGSYTCSCNSGYTGNGSVCYDINECMSDPCDNNANCTNTNGSYTCSCNSGYTGNGSVCYDINECMSDPCDNNANCTNTNGSYTCSCNSGYTGNRSVCYDINECISDPCDNNANCTNTNGSYTCSCNSGYTVNGSVCYDINECMSDPCDNNANCINTNGSYTCSCNSGYTGNGSVCYDINECISDPCDNNANCTNTNGQYACSCNSGYTGNGSVCYDINECMSDPCDNANCTNTNGSYTCSCNSGYTGNGSVCYDINECMLDPCDNNANCTNTNGSYTCSCNSGYTGNGSVCYDINECMLDPCDNNANCTNTNGSYSCSCNSGYTGNGSVCYDINECMLDPCDNNANCTNTDGAYKCSCNMGFTGNGSFCMLIDPCFLTCDINARCENASGSYRCLCNSGYSGDGTSCSDVDECLSTICSVNATCQNRQGSFSCDCKEGFYGNGTVCEVCLPSLPCPGNSSCVLNGTDAICQCDPGFNGNSSICVDIDECANQTLCGDNANCNNTVGSYSCRCNDGYSDRNGNGLICVDVNECSTDKPCNANANCANTNGSYVCTCKDGYTGNGLICVDVNECSTDKPCNANANCANTNGSYECSCKDGYTGNGLICVDVNECSTDKPCNANANCANTNGSYECSCKDGYTGNGLICVDVNECSTDKPCNANANCANTNGSYECSCKDGYTGNGLICVDVNECSTDKPCNANANCANTNGSYECSCKDGYTGNGLICVDVNECSTDKPCNANANCANTNGSYECTCKDGYTGNGLICVDVNECSTDKPCNANANCANTNGSYECSCKDGYTGNGLICVDVNECSTDKPCNANANCANTNGSYECSCKDGYTGNGLICVDVNECSTDKPCNANANCANTNGSYECSCKDGYTGNGLICVDVNECSTDKPCNANANCANTNGSYECSCKDGYTGNGLICVDVNECSTDKPCNANANCANTNGSYECSCKDGYTGNGLICVDVNECSTDKPCNANANCANTNGSYECTCKDGYTGNGLICVDVNECSTGNPCNANANCANTNGSYECSCKDGYTGNGLICVDVNECSTDKPCNANANCANTNGSYECSCKDGYTGNGLICVDVNECSTDKPCNANANCANTNGSYECTCKDGYTGDGLTCVDVNECSTGNPCNANANCANTNGSYVCSCKDGYTGDGTTKCNLRLQWQFTLISAFVYTRNLSNPSSSQYNNTFIAVEDALRRSFTGVTITIIQIQFFQGSVLAVVDVEIQDNKTSQEVLDSYNATEGANTFVAEPSTVITQCINKPCKENEDCRTVVGGDYNCQCQSGFVNISGVCRAQSCNQCSSDASCNDTTSPVQCTCNSGFSGDGITCSDIDECNIGNPCLNGECENTNGSYQCQCNLGTQNISGNCTPQCSTDFCKNGAICEATLQVGNPVCICPTGFAGIQCTDTDTTYALAIAFGVIAAVILIGLIALGIWLYRRRNAGGMDIDKLA